MRIVAYRATHTPDATIAYGRTTFETLDNLQKAVGRSPLAEGDVEFDPIIVDPDPRSILITQVR